MTSYELPPEIWQEIIEISASTSLRQAAVLAQVSSTFHHWVNPFLCRTVLHYPGTKGWPFAKPTLPWFEQNGQYLQNLMWGNEPGLDLLISILEHCPALDNLAVWVHAPSCNMSSLRPVLSKLRLRKLSINVFALFKVDRFGIEEANDPMFSRITHLHVINHSDMRDWEHLDGLAHIPTLTHVALQYTASSTAINGVLKHCKKLKILVGIGCAHAASDEMDPRYQALDIRSLHEWEAGALGGEDRFRQAEIKVEKLEAIKRDFSSLEVGADDDDDF